MKRLFAALVLSLAIVAPAIAQDAKPTWTGFYIGAHGGLDATSIGVDTPILGVNGLSANGAAFGGHAGFDLQLPNSPLVLGVGADYTWSNAEFSVSPGLLSLGIENSATIYGRVGFSLGDVLPYATVGYTWADAKARSALLAASASESLEGWMLGGGVEFRLADHLTLAGEYRYTKFDSVGVIPGVLSLDPERHEVRAALKYRFNPF